MSISTFSLLSETSLAAFSCTSKTGTAFTEWAQSANAELRSKSCFYISRSCASMDTVNVAPLLWGTEDTVSVCGSYVMDRVRTRRPTREIGTIVREQSERNQAMPDNPEYGSS